MQFNYIANASAPSSSGRTIPVIDPSDGQPYDDIQRSNASDIDAADTAILLAVLALGAITGGHWLAAAIAALIGRGQLIDGGFVTPADLDRTVKDGLGLRWSFMGNFLIYRIAGGEQGMRHFMAQFGPALKLPWTKLEAPELTEGLLDKIVAQSDEQAGAQSIRELERLRDDCLIAVMQGLQAQDWGAGQVLKRYAARLYDTGLGKPEIEAVDLAQPLALYRTRIPTDWLDYNGHVNESRYLQLFSDSCDALLRLIETTPNAHTMITPTIAASTVSTSGDVATVSSASPPASARVARPASRSPRASASCRRSSAITATSGFAAAQHATSFATSRFAVSATARKRSGWRAMTSSALPPIEPVAPSSAIRFIGYNPSRSLPATKTAA